MFEPTNMKTSGTIWDFFVNNQKFTFLIAAAMVVFGILAAIQLPKESDPEVNIPVAFVSTPFIGASVEEVEELVTNPIEDKLTGINDIESITSVSSVGISSINIEFSPDADAREVLDELKDKVDEAAITLPDNTEDPIVKQVSFDDVPFLTLSISGPYDLAELTVYAKQLERAVERVSGVSKVDVLGGQEREVQILVDKAKLDSFGLGIGQVTQAISQANSDIPVGAIETAGEVFNVRFAGRLADKDEIAEVPIVAINSVPILIADVAEVIDGYAERTSISKLSVDGGEAFPAITIRVYKSAGGNIVRIAEKIKQKSEKLVLEQFPEGVQVRAVEDVAEFIKKDLSSLTKNGIATVLIVIFLLVIFIGWREALLAGFSIPLAFLSTFIGLFYFGMTINFITLFALILSLGILVDSAIVINEGLHKHRKSGKSARQAAYDTIREFQYPLMSGTLTTVFAFVPMLLTGGIVGEYIKSIPVTVTLVLVSSLFIALALVTTISSALFERLEKHNATKHDDVSTKRRFSFEPYIQEFKQKYESTLRAYLQNKLKRKKLKRLLLLLFVLSFALPATGILKVQMFGSGDIHFFGFDLEKPVGTPLQTTESALEPIINELYTDPRIETFVVNTGQTLNLDGQGGRSGSHLASILVNLSDNRKEKSYEIVDEYQDKFANFDNGLLSVAQPGSGPGTAAPVEVKISGEDLKELDRISADMLALVANIPDTRNARRSVVTTNGQFVVEIDRIRAKQYGVGTAEIALTMRNAISGITATEINSGGEDVDVVVKYRLQAHNPEHIGLTQTDIATIEGLTIATPQGDIPLSSFVQIGIENSRESIRHEDGDRLVTVTSNVAEKVSPLEIFDEIRKQLDTIDIPEEYVVTMGGENEDTAESFADMLRAMIFAVLLIAALLVLQFKSFRQSALILITIPLALIGVFPGLLLVGQPISFPGVIGIVALAGIVVNNAIILIDKINTNRRSGLQLEESIVQAGIARIEPIILTTITTVCGILPLALTQEIWAGLGYSIIFGLLVSTVTTLLVIPLLYRRLYRKKSR